MKSLSRLGALSILLLLHSGWGFFAHERINRLAVFTLPPEMIGFYKKNLLYLEEASVNPDKRRYAIPAEASRHYIDLDDYGDSALTNLPHHWSQAVKKFGEDSLMSHGIVPWHINRMFLQLKDAFLIGDPSRILRISAELGHYVADAHVPLHTTSNYNGQKTGQVGIHGLWESRLPELFSHEYDFFVGMADYIENVQLTAWDIVQFAHSAVDSVLLLERDLAASREGQKYSFETKSRQTVKVYSYSYAAEYNKLLKGMVERQMRASIKMVGNIWYSAWVDAGQPDLNRLINYQPTPGELEKRREELEQWKIQTILSRSHEPD